MKSKNFMLTKNNPKESLEEFHQILKADSVYARVQLELSASGTPHYQACVGYKNERHMKALIKQFDGCHIEVARNAMRAWKYCGKEDTRKEGPLESGVPPAAKNVKGDTKTRNEYILKHGVCKAVDEGHLPLEKLKQVQQSVDLYRLMSIRPPSIDKLLGEWHWGATGTGKSYGVRQEYPDAYIKSNSFWWDGYQGEETVIYEEMGPKQVSGHHIKQWADHHPFQAAVKGSF